MKYYRIKLALDSWVICFHMYNRRHYILNSEESQNEIKLSVKIWLFRTGREKFEHITIERWYTDITEHRG